MFQIPLRLRFALDVPLRPILVKRDRAVSRFSWVKIQFGLMLQGRSGMKKKAQTAMGMEMTASMIKIHLDGSVTPLVE